jgi:hypothetical protein
MYFHQCNSATVGAGTGCNTGTGFNSTFKLNGNPGSQTYILGEIIADKVSLSGTPSVNMQLNPYAAYNTLKATLLR